MTLTRANATTMADFVTLGMAAECTADTVNGTITYGADGAIFTASPNLYVDWDATDDGGDLTYLRASSGTVAFKVKPTWAGNDGAAHTFWTAGVEALTGTIFKVWKSAANLLAAQFAAATTSPLSSMAVTWLADTSHTIVGRWVTGTQTRIDLNLDGTDATASTTNPDAAPASWTRSLIGTDPLAMGPLVICRSRKSDTWVTDITASSGAALDDVVALFRDSLEVGDAVFPLASATLGYVKISDDPTALSGNVLVLGDSLTAGAYSSVAATSFASLVFDNLETLGATTLDRQGYNSTTAGDLSVYLPAIAATSYDYAIIEAGTNDVGDSTPLLDFEADYIALIEASRAVKTPEKTVLCGVWMGDGSTPTPEAYNTVISRLATAYDCEYVSLDDISASTTNYGPAGVVGWKGTSDNWHPNDAGHQAIADAIWTAIGEGPATAALFSVSDARAFANAVLASATDYTDTDIIAKEVEIRERFERHCGVRFVPATVTETLSGDGTSTLMLGQHNPVLERPRRPIVVSAATVDDTALTATELLDVFADCDGLMHRDGSYWPATEPHNVVVTYTVGWSAVPAAIKRAALIVAVNELPTSNWSDRATSVSDGVMNAQLVTAGVRGAATSLPDVNAILSEYSEKGPGIA